MFTELTATRIKPWAEFMGGLYLSRSKPYMKTQAPSIFEQENKKIKEDKELLFVYAGRLTTIETDYLNDISAR